MGLYKWLTGCLWRDYLRVSSVMLYQGIIPGWVVVLCTWIKKQNGLLAFGLQRSMTATEWNEGPFCATQILIGKNVGKNCPLRLWPWMKCCQTWSSKPVCVPGCSWVERKGWRYDASVKNSMWRIPVSSGAVANTTFLSPPLWRSAPKLSPYFKSWQRTHGDHFY